MALLVAAAAFLAYWPCLRGEFIWDDDAWTTNLAELFHSLSGLRAIWSWPTPLQQYYPLTATTFWIDYQLWGFWTVPYHVENVLLHLLAAGLFWRLLKRLEVPGAGLAAVILVLHPLMVESVAWITERKNVLSLALFLGALLAYGRFANLWAAGPKRASLPGGPSAAGADPPCVSRNWGAWACALLLFLAAYVAKATTFAFPAVVLLLCWWKRGRLRWRQDVLPTLPFFAASLRAGPDDLLAGTKPPRRPGPGLGDPVPGAVRHCRARALVLCRQAAFARPTIASFIRAGRWRSGPW